MPTYSGTVGHICMGRAAKKTEIREYLAGRAQIVRINPLDEYNGVIY